MMDYDLVIRLNFFFSVFNLLLLLLHLYVENYPY